MGSGASTQIRSLDTTSRTSPDPSNTAASPVAAKEPSRGMTKTETSSSLNARALPKTPIMPLEPSSSTSDQSLEQPTAKGKVQPKDQGLEKKLKQLQKELAESESDKLDLQDRMQALEERIEELTAAPPAGSVEGSAAGAKGSDHTELQETLHAKDQYIQQMERQLASVQADSNKVKLRLKKRIKNLTAQLNEAKQESSIAQLELKERNRSLQDQLHHSHQDQASNSDAATPLPDGEEQDSRMKVILDLSTEVSEQAHKISELQRQVEDRDKEINQLRQAATLKANSLPPTMEHPSDGNPPHSRSTQDSVHSSRPRKSSQGQHLNFSGRGGQIGVVGVESTPVYDNSFGSWQHSSRPVSKIGPRSNAGSRQDTELTLHRQSTALSDSDSDWEVDGASAKIHSAPARVRVKSAATAVEEKLRNSEDMDKKWGPITDDNDLTFTSEAKPDMGSSSRQKRRSALKTKLERQKNERAKCLMGPSLAFGPPSGDQLSDTSCNPTPRAPEKVPGFTGSDTRAFAV